MRQLEIIVEDYTQLPVGIQIAKGITARCPRCTKVGVVENREGKISYFHRLGYKFIADEKLPGIIDETCSNVETSPETTHHK